MCTHTLAPSFVDCSLSLSLSLSISLSFSFSRVFLLQVAIKTLKASGESEAEEFLAEAHLMTKLEHKNLVRLIGVVTSTNPIMMVFEYMSKVCVCVCVCVWQFLEVKG